MTDVKITKTAYAFLAASALGIGTMAYGTASDVSDDLSKLSMLREQPELQIEIGETSNITLFGQIAAILGVLGFAASNRLQFASRHRHK